MESPLNSLNFFGIIMLRKLVVNISSKIVFHDLLADNLIRFSLNFVESKSIANDLTCKRIRHRPQSKALLVMYPNIQDCLCLVTQGAFCTSEKHSMIREEWREGPVLL